MKADANATNAFLVGGLEPTAARAGYTDGIATAARTLAAAASANPDDATALQAVNRVLVELHRADRVGARATTARGSRSAPRTCARRRHDPAGRAAAAPIARHRRAAARRRSIRRCQLAAHPSPRRPVDRVRRARRAPDLAVPQDPPDLQPVAARGEWRRGLVGVVGIGVIAWSRSSSQDARDGSYRQTVALATARINGFDAKSAEALTLINRGSGQPFEDRFKTLAKSASSALGSTAGRHRRRVRRVPHRAQAGPGLRRRRQLGPGGRARHRHRRGQPRLRDVRDRLGPRPRRPGELALRRARQRPPAADRDGVGPARRRDRRGRRHVARREPAAAGVPVSVRRPLAEGRAARRCRRARRRGLFERVELGRPRVAGRELLDHHDDRPGPRLPTRWRRTRRAARCPRRAMPCGSYMAQIQQRGRLIAGVSADTLLFGFRNPLTGHLEGFDIDLVRPGRAGDLRRPATGSSTRWSRTRSASRRSWTVRSTSSPT